MPIVVGVTLRPLSGSEFPPKLALNRSYFESLEDAGAVALPIPLVRDPERLRSLYGHIDALLLPGGADIEPRRYGAAARSDCHLSLAPDLDEVELRLAEWAMADGLPVLGICRGIQVLNVACGGTLWQDVRVEGAVSESHDQEPRDALVHDLDVEPDSLLARAIGATHVRVNSLHHQAIRDLGAPLRAVARSSDGLIEGVELPSANFVLGVQCHPEELSRKEAWAAGLFSALVDAVEERRSRGILGRP
ncbi:MAG TPA: gamma-glutamyl-gamma-aminobutyrate hydrolase family protein [Candidatus Dormibacteraeota bacterium]|nr:gamma-glutamyl-gamma-aminobutyrate hydrolase family protein [Candidatus Dormibacteraeota bacterium]